MTRKLWPLFLALVGCAATGIDPADSGSTEPESEADAVADCVAAQRIVEACGCDETLSWETLSPPPDLVQWLVIDASAHEFAEGNCAGTLSQSMTVYGGSYDVPHNPTHATATAMDLGEQRGRGVWAVAMLYDATILASVYADVGDTGEPLGLEF